MGFEPLYVFNFQVAEQSNSPVNPTVHPITPKLIQDNLELRRADTLWQRIWDESVSISTSMNQ